MTVNSRVIKTFLAWSPDAVDVPLMNGLRVQILPTIDEIPRARKHQFAAFIASEALLVVWDDDPSHLLERAKSIEAELMQLVWQTGEPTEEEDTNEKKNPRVTEYEVDQESGQIIPEMRPTNLMNTILVGFTLVIVVVMLGAGFRAVAIETVVDKNYLRMAFVLLTPVQVFFTLVQTSPTSLKPQANNHSSLHKSLLAALRNVLVLFAKCSSIRNTTQPNARPVCRVACYLILPSSALSTGKVLPLLLLQPSNRSSKLSPPMSFKAVLPTCSSMMTVYNFLTRTNGKPGSTFMRIIQSAGLRVPRMGPMAFSAAANSKRYAVNKFAGYSTTRLTYANRHPT
jgi:hypothetical protein